MGILNVTPDSFSDGGVHFDTQTAIDAGFRMRDEGADIIDIGGESTRPNSEPVSMEEELRRTLPVVQALAQRGIPVSIDTSKPEVARQALEAGAGIVNDVTAFSDPGMAPLCAQHGCTVCLMHMKGTPRTMQQDPTYEDVVAEVRDFLLERTQHAEAQGIARESIWIDPGIGFGKTVEHNLQLLRNLDEFVLTGYNVLIGVSRKSFIGRILNPETPLPADQRLEGTLAAQVLAQAMGAKIIRAHDVKESRRAIEMAKAILG
jgi:dihydropteroate synthase